MSGDDPLVGTEVGRYHVARVLGQGGMGTVYEGVQAESGASVAIKVLSERYARDAELIERFFSEARATTVIAHENIVKVHDLAQLPDGRPYIVMELLAGKTLRALIAEAQLPIGGVVNVALEVLSALAATHAAGIVHRDIKPDNIFITVKGHTKVLDFGIAKLSGVNAVARTQTGVVLGTPEYMAPEQITDGTVDVRTDLYALGVVLFEALTGRRPFDAKSDFEVMRAHVSDDVPSARTRRPDLPVALDDIVRCALSKDPRDRFASAGAMATALLHVATEISVAEWRSLVPGGRLMSPRPPSIPPAVQIPSSDARATVRDVKPTSVTVAERPGARKKAKAASASTAPIAPRRSRPWLLLAGLAIAGIAGGVIATQVGRETTPHEVAPVVAVAAVPARSSSPAPPSPPPAETPVQDPVVVASEESPVPVDPGRRPRGPRRPSPTIATRTGTTTTTSTTTTEPAKVPPSMVAPAPQPKIDPDHFDWRGFIATARTLARGVADDAEWVAMSLDAVAPDGHVKLERGRMGRTFYVFRSAKRKEGCDIRVIVSATGTVVSEIPGHGFFCDAKPIGTPRCGLTHPRERAGIAKDQDAALLWTSQGWWADAPNARWVADDCGEPPPNPFDLRMGTMEAGRNAVQLRKDAELVRISVVVLDEQNVDITYEYRSSTLDHESRGAGVQRSCIVVAHGAAKISYHPDDCVALSAPVKAPRCTIQQLKAVAKVKPDVRRVAYEYTMSGWKLTIRQRDSSRDTLHLKDDCP